MSNFMLIMIIIACLFIMAASITNLVMFEISSRVSNDGTPGSISRENGIALIVLNALVLTIATAVMVGYIVRDIYARKMNKQAKFVSAKSSSSATMTGMSPLATTATSYDTFVPLPTAPPMPTTLSVPNPGGK